MKYFTVLNHHQTGIIACLFACFIAFSPAKIKPNIILSSTPIAIFVKVVVGAFVKCLIMVLKRENTLFPLFRKKCNVPITYRMTI